MSRKAVVFLGPSLPVELARTVLDADYRAPCRMGDVFVASQDAPRAIVIIDGFFEQTPAVWHKEILHALSRGIPVFGGASMGALRACELDGFGMVGVGRIYRSYAGGEIEDDDEVAVAHLPAEAGYRCRSDAMVNIRYGLELAQAAGCISASTRDALLHRAKRLHYPSRSWHELWKQTPAAEAGEAELARLRTFIEERQPDLKREDALEVLSTVARQLANDNPCATPDFQFEPTIFWEHLCTHFVSTRRDSGGIAAERLVQHARLLDPQRGTLRERALLLFLVQGEARRLGLGLAEPRAALQRFRRERGLASPPALRDWLARERASQQECLDLAQMEATIRAVAWRYSEQVDEFLPRALKLDGRYGEVVARVERKWARLRDMGIDAPTDADVESVDAVLEWYQRRFGAVAGELPAHVVELGFGSPRQFLGELIAEYLGEQEVCDEPA